MSKPQVDAGQRRREAEIFAYLIHVGAGHFARCRRARRRTLSVTDRSSPNHRRPRGDPRLLHGRARWSLFRPRVPELEADLRVRPLMHEVRRRAAIAPLARSCTCPCSRARSVPRVIRIPFRSSPARRRRVRARRDERDGSRSACRPSRCTCPSARRRSGSRASSREGETA